MTVTRSVSDMTPTPVSTSSVAATTAPDAKVLKAARDFEAMAIGQMLEPMFATVDTSKSMFSGGAGEESFKPMLVTEMAKEVEAHGGLGLADGIYQQMLKMQEGRR